jgi:hypothetical protein
MRKADQMKKEPIKPEPVKAPGSAVQRSLEALAEIRSSQLTDKEMEILEAFEAFRLEHPLRLTSRDEER